MPDFADLLRQAAQDAGTAPPGTITPGGLPADFAEEPVSLSVFVQDAKFLKNPPLSPVQYEAVRHIERIYYNGWFRQEDESLLYVPERDTYRQLADQLESGTRPGRFHVGAVSAWREEKYWSTAVRMTNFATLQWGKGGGKDHICRIASLRIAYLLLCLDSPQQYYELPDQDSIHLLNVASSSGQAQQAFFIPVVRAVKRAGGWFADKCEPKQNLISYAKNVESVSGHSDAETQEGLNLLLGIADEIDAFKSKAELTTRRGASAREPTKSAEGILKMMHSSGSTRFPEVFKQVRISYPRYLGSTIQTLTAAAKLDIDTNGIDSRHYVSGPLATWEVNPRVKGRSAFAEDYKEDPIMARARYECRPARAINPYFRNHQAVDAAFHIVTEPPVDVAYQLDRTSKVWLPRYHFAQNFWPVRGALYALHADMAVSGDRAGIAMAHVSRWIEHELDAEDEDGALHPIRELRPHVVVDFVISYAADSAVAPPREIQIRWARQLAFELIRRGFAVRRFTFDSFQSTDSMQILQSKGIECDKVSTDTSEDPWRNLRDLMSEFRVTIPRVDGPSLLRDELLSLTRLPNGRIDHPSDGSKDQADALACAVLGAVTLGGAEQEDQERAYVGTAEFATGQLFELPLGVQMSKVWQHEVPEPFWVTAD